MGVYGFTRYLSEEGWLPPDCRECCRTSLWLRDPNGASSSLFAGVSRSIRTIRPRPVPRPTLGNATTTSNGLHSNHSSSLSFHIDGNGLAFFLFDVAYARHVQKVIHEFQQPVSTVSSSATHSGQKCCCPTIQSVLATTQTSGKETASKHKSHKTKNNRQPPDNPSLLPQILPNFVPLDIVEDVTKEFIEALLQRKNRSPSSTSFGSNAYGSSSASAASGNSVFVYWDGDARHVVKQQTDAQRTSKVRDSWGNYQQYCHHGKLPSTREKNACICAWKSEFPKPRLYFDQVFHTIEYCFASGSSKNPASDGLVHNVSCNEECDHIIAKAASGNINAYVLANDTDFCFFPDINYVPFTTLHVRRGASGGGGIDISGNNGATTITGCVLRREELAEAIGLASPAPPTLVPTQEADDSDGRRVWNGSSTIGHVNEQAMVELAILCGNDYLTDPSSAKLDFYATRIEDCITHLQQQDVGYKISSTSESTQNILDFVRALYSFGDLSKFPLVAKSETKRNADSEEETSSDDEVGRPTMPSDFDFDLVRLDPRKDRSIKDAVVRCLQLHVNRSRDDSSSRGPFVLKQEHIDAFRKMDLQKDKRAVNNVSFGKHTWWRPNWADVAAAYMITKAISSCLTQSASSPLTRFASPRCLFDSYIFHLLLQQNRGQARPKSTGVDLSSHAIKSLSGKQRIIGSARKDRESHSVPNVSKPEFDQPVEKLPVDEHKETILESIRKNRVTIIQGETGCGKSSRIPAMILKAAPPDDAMSRCKLFISQPRRIAAKALVERLRATEPTLRNHLALRMGQGVREYESRETRAWFVTAGYLVRLLANHPEHFDDVSHLIIDEVHERSVETDLLCLLCRRLLETNKRIRLILMSATLAAKLYQDYFGVTEDPIRVGARRFPVKEIFIEDIASQLKLPPAVRQKVESIRESCDNLKCDETPSMAYMEKIYSVVSNLTIVIGQPGTAVLIFVPGMNDIVALTEAIEKLYVAGVRFSTFPIHGDIPYEDQMAVFDAPEDDEVKVIIATNAAESSVTLPLVDHVICFGLCKQIVYNASSHRQMLVPTWISRASATQRAGRTGRVRPGTVYRLYTRRNFEQDMDEFELGEMSRIPLDNVILLLKGMLSSDSTTEVLLDCLEPPDISTIDRSFKNLYQSHFITSPEDDSEITTLGNFVSVLGVDLSLGSMIGLGIQFGVGAEAMQMASVLSFPKQPWTMSNPLIHEPREYNELTTKAYTSRCKFDSDLFSEPLSIMNLLWDYESINESGKQSWCRQNALAYSRVRRLFSACTNLRKRVADFCGVDPEKLKLECPPRDMPHAKLNILRVVQVWLFQESMIECKTDQFSVGHLKDAMVVPLLRGSDHISKAHLAEVLSQDRHPFSLIGSSIIRHRGSFKLPDKMPFSLQGLEERFVSYGKESECDLIWCWDQYYEVVFVSAKLAQMESFSDHLRKLQEVFVTSYIYVETRTGKLRGIHERACGSWVVKEVRSEKGREPDLESIAFVKLANKVMAAKNGKRGLTKEIRLSKFIQDQKEMRALSCDVTKARQTKKFTITCFGFEKPASKVDLQDLLAASQVNFDEVKEEKEQQLLEFSVVEPSMKRPMFKCIPEGARLLSVLASGRRREHLIRLTPKEDIVLDILLDKSQTKLSNRWKRLNSDSAVYVNENSVAATALPLGGGKTLYCVASNSLEVRGGGLRVEGLTLLPPGRFFFMLARVSFGLFQKENLDAGVLADKCLRWTKLEGPHYGLLGDEQAARDRFEEAIKFHLEAENLGEKLECSPVLTQKLVDLFDGVDGYSADAEDWDIAKNPFTREKLTGLSRAVSDV